MFSTLTFNNFKSFRDAQLPLGPLTVLIAANAAANAAGKSNAIEALRLLSWAGAHARIQLYQRPAAAWRRQQPVQRAASVVGRRCRRAG